MSNFSSKKNNKKKVKRVKVKRVEEEVLEIPEHVKNYDFLKDIFDDVEFEENR